MVKVFRNDEGDFYTCEVCGMAYKEKILAKKCEDYCTKNNACSLAITQHSVEIKQ